jgi:hypothetical protein
MTYVEVPKGLRHHSHVSGCGAELLPMNTRLSNVIISGIAWNLRVAVKDAGVSPSNLAGRC